MTALDRLEEAAQDLAATPLAPDVEAADWIGRLAHVSKVVNDYKRALLAEMTGPAIGDKYQVVETNSAERSYNSASILHAFAEEGWSLSDLVRVDAVRLSWRWTQLQTAVRQARVTLTVAQREVEDLGEVEGPMVGEVWKVKQEVRGA